MQRMHTAYVYNFMISVYWRKSNGYYVWPQTKLDTNIRTKYITHPSEHHLIIPETNIIQAAGQTFMYLYIYSSDRKNPTAVANKLFLLFFIWKMEKAKAQLHPSCWRTHHRKLVQAPGLRPSCWRTHPQKLVQAPHPNSRAPPSRGEGSSVESRTDQVGTHLLTPIVSAFTFFFRTYIVNTVSSELTLSWTVNFKRQSNEGGEPDAPC